MLDDEQQEDAPAAEGDDDAVDVADAVDAEDAGGEGGDDDAIDIGAAGAGVETADEPAVSAEELLDMPDDPERWDEEGVPIDPGPRAAGEERAQAAADAGAAAAAEDAGEGAGTSDE